jgi:hypothetical protein
VDSKLSRFPDPTILQVIFLENLSKTIYFNLSKLDWIFFQKEKRWTQSCPKFPDL